MSERQRRPIARLMREPAVHFLVLGGLLFGLYALVQPGTDSRRIEISATLVESLRQDHVRRTGQPPSEAEEAALIEQLVDDEVLFREAVALGLDRGDPVVRRRLIQKMRFLTEDLAAVPEPRAVDLEAYLQRHPDRYALPERLAIRHVFIRRAAGTQSDMARAESALQALRSGADPEALGDPFLHGYAFSERSAESLDARFGPGFSQALEAVPVGSWSGPVRSSYGLHLVRVDSRQSARAASLDEVMDEVRRDFLEERRAAANREALDQLRAQYQVVIEAWQREGGTPSAASPLAER